ncbi:MAG: hypothetical protein ACTSYI_05995 [Promethearchaeota archaeon]
MLKDRIRDAFSYQIINIALLCILYLIIKYELWTELLIFLIVLIPIEIGWYAFKQSTIVDIYLTKIYLKVIPSKFFKYRHLERKFGIISHKKLNLESFHPIYSKRIGYLPLIIKIIASDPTLLKQMPPYARSLFEFSKAHGFDFNSLQKIYGYYREEPIYLAYRHGKGEKLENYEVERIIYESTLQARLLLENNLPANHPILHEINERHKIPLGKGFTLIK